MSRQQGSGKMVSVGVKHSCIALVVICASVTAADKAWPRRTPVVEAVEKAAPAVVNIGTERIVTQRYDPFYNFRGHFFDDPFEEFFRPYRSRQFKTTSLGSGVMIDADGYVATNEHVVARASKIHVNLKDGSTYEGRLICSDPDRDLAVIKLDAGKRLPAIELGSSGDLMLGETAIAIGNPFGLESSVSVGVVSAINRSIQAGEREVMSGLIQSDAAINPGNSGGALVNINGELIGINTAIYAQAQNIGFAIPVDQVKKVMGEILDYGTIKRLQLGIDVQELTHDLAAQVGAKPGEGVLVAGVVPGGPAAKAGLERLDLITQVDDRPVTCLFDLRLGVLKHKAGDTIHLKIRRDRRLLAKSLVVAEIPLPSAEALATEKFGLTLRELTRQEAQKMKLGALEGQIVLAVEHGSPAAQAGVERGDIVTQIAGQPATGEGLALVLEKVQRGQTVYFLLIRERVNYRGLMTAR